MATSDLSTPAPAPLPPRTLESGRLGLGGQPDPCDPSPQAGFPLLRGLGGLQAGGPHVGPLLLLCGPCPPEEFYQANPLAIGRSPGVSRREGGSCCGSCRGHAPAQFSRTRTRAGELISSPELTSGSCSQSLQTTKPLWDQHLGQKRS